MANRVLIIGEYGTLNGGENSLLAIIPMVQKFGWEFSAAVPADSPFDTALMKLGVETISPELFDQTGKRYSQSEIRESLTQIICRIKPDLVHCNSLSTSRLVGPITRALKIPGLGYLRDILKLSRQAIEDINQLNRIIAVSQATRDYHCGRGLAAESTYVNHNGVDTELFHPQVPGTDCPIRKELAIAPKDPVLLFVGQIGMRKGIDVLLNSYLEIAKTYHKTHLVVVGKRHSQKAEAIEFEQTVMEIGNQSPHSENVHWLGTRTDIPELMRAATVLVHPARQEPLGRVLLEAAACGLPIVTTRVGGSMEILASQELDYFLVQPDDVDAIAAKVNALIQDPDLRESQERLLRKRACEAFQVESCALRLDGHYRDLLPTTN